uniref:Uncharacterized protein n=1 Tax=Toxoplasma gondii TgCATBr9 TaxID=943120 RepID=A0A2T6IJT7_TOXGO|nr:hypothetical protein TGBR9_384050 [Toxoplasma gondii TgCATBr9]
MSSPTSASSASVNSSVNSLGSLPCSGAEAHRSAGRLPSGDRGASSSYPTRSPQLGRFQLLLFVLSRLRSLRTSPLAFEEDQEKDDEFQALEESAGPDSGDCLQGDARGLQAVRPQQRRAAALRASGSKAHLLLLLPQLIACIGCDDRYVRPRPRIEVLSWYNGLTSRRLEIYRFIFPFRISCLALVSGRFCSLPLRFPLCSCLSFCGSVVLRSLCFSVRGAAASLFLFVPSLLCLDVEKN